jgi:carbon monoxide dehydrogenase subunit G
MHVEGTREFDASPEIVWLVLNDPKRLSAALPAVEDVEIDDEDHWHAAVRLPVGPKAIGLKLRFERVVARRPEHAQLRARGKSFGASLGIDTSFRLSPAGDGTTMAWEADIELGGLLGRMGSHVLQPLVNHQVGSVMGALVRQVEAARAEATEGGGRSAA